MECCSPSLTHAWYLVCVGTPLAAAQLCGGGGPGCMAPEPLAEEGKAPGGLQGSKACGQQPVVPARRTHHPEAFCTPADAFEWFPASGPHPAPKPAGCCAPGRGLPAPDGAEPLLLGGQCRSISLPTSRPPPNLSVGHFSPRPPSAHLPALHPQPGTPPAPAQPAGWGRRGLVVDFSNAGSVTLSFFIFFLPDAMDASEPAGCRGAERRGGQRGGTAWGPPADACWLTCGSARVPWFCPQSSDARPPGGDRRGAGKAVPVPRSQTAAGI